MGCEKCSLQSQQIAINFFIRMINIGCIQPGTLLDWLHTNERTKQNEISSNHQRR